MALPYTACFFDSPQVLDCSVTSIPGSGSSTLQVVASTPDKICQLVISDAVGEYVGIYKGAVGQETLVAMVCSGSLYSVDCVIPKSSRISLRSMTAAALVTGTLCISFISRGELQ
jgi:hypothetical protein